MKLTKETLKQIIKEELEATLREAEGQDLDAELDRLQAKRHAIQKPFNQKLDTAPKSERDQIIKAREEATREVEEKITAIQKQQAKDSGRMFLDIYGK